MVEADATATPSTTTLEAMPDLGTILVDLARTAVPGRGGATATQPGDAREADVAGGDEAGGDEAGEDRSDPDRPDALPTGAVRVANVAVGVDDIADYAGVCGFRLDDTVPVTWPATLGFPLGLWLMTRPEFPHAPLGLVHVRDRIHAVDHLRIGDVVDVTARLANQRPHRRGTQFDVEVEVARDGDVVWTEASTHLRRGATPATDAADAADAADDGGRRNEGPSFDAGALPLTGRWPVPADQGRRYAAVSGDRNPIHLTAATAKAFGFRRAIAHGMWTTAAALAGLGALPRPVTIDVAFRKPLLLPSTVDYATERTDAGWHLAVRRRDHAPHLVATVRG